MYTDPTPRNAGSQVVGFSQSKGGSPDREPTRTGRPRPLSRATTRRPVLPVPPRTSVVVFLIASSLQGPNRSIPSCAALRERLAADEDGKADASRPDTCE